MMPIVFHSIYIPSLSRGPSFEGCVAFDVVVLASDCSLSFEVRAVVCKHLAICNVLKAQKKLFNAHTICCWIPRHLCAVEVK